MTALVHGEGAREWWWVSGYTCTVPPPTRQECILPPIRRCHKKHGVIVTCQREGCGRMFMAVWRHVTGMWSWRPIPEHEPEVIT